METEPRTPSESHKDEQNHQDGTPDDRTLNTNFASDEDGDDDPEALVRTKSTRSIADTLPWYREVLFVAVICLGQLYTRKSWPHST